MSSDTVNQLTEIEHGLVAAWVAQDPSFHDKTLADDWSVIDPTGRVLTKSEVLNESFSGKIEIVKGEIDDINVRDFGDWAIVTGRTIGAVRNEGATVEFELRFTDVFRRLNDDWQCVASQGTFLN